MTAPVLISADAALTSSTQFMQVGSAGTDRVMIVWMWTGDGSTISQVTIGGVSKTIQNVDRKTSGSLQVDVVMIKESDFGATGGQSVGVVPSSGTHIWQAVFLSGAIGESVASQISPFLPDGTTGSVCNQARASDALICRGYGNLSNNAPSNRGGLTLQDSFSSGGSYIEVATGEIDDTENISYTNGAGTTVSSQIQVFGSDASPTDPAGPDQLTTQTSTSTTANLNITNNRSGALGGRYIACIGVCHRSSALVPLTEVRFSNVVIGRSVRSRTGTTALVFWEITEADLVAAGVPADSLQTFQVRANSGFGNSEIVRAVYSFENAQFGDTRNGQDTTGVGLDSNYRLVRNNANPNVPNMTTIIAVSQRVSSGSASMKNGNAMDRDDIALVSNGGSAEVWSSNPTFRPDGNKDNALRDTLQLDTNVTAEKQSAFFIQRFDVPPAIEFTPRVI